MDMKCLCGSSDLNLMGHRDGYPIHICHSCLSIINSEYNYNISLYSGTSYDDYQVVKGVPKYTDRYDHDVGVAYKRIMKFIGYNDIKSILDIGCSKGAFVDVCHRLMYDDTWGIDVVDSVYDRNMIQDSFLGFDFDRTFDMVCLFDVFEHFDMEVASHKIKQLADKYIFFDQPDPSSSDAIMSGITWKHIKPLEHYVLASQKLISIIFHEYDLIKSESPIKGRMSLLYRRRT